MGNIDLSKQDEWFEKFQKKRKVFRFAYVVVSWNEVVHVAMDLLVADCCTVMF